MRKIRALRRRVRARLFALPGSGALSADSTQTYIVQMLPNPVVTYAGGISGLPATKPGKGKKIDPSSSDVTKYADYLKGKHDQALSHVGGGQKLYDYVYSLNGFAAKLTEDQATRLSAQKNVLAVSPDEIQTIQTSSTPHFLGLDVKGGLWDQLGGVSKGGLNKGAGEDEVIGVIDSGVWPESQSFSDRKLDGSNGNNYPHKVTGFSGACQTGEQWTASNCNNKLISARYFNAAQGGNEGIDEDLPWEFTSPRDYNGHGTHTSSTAGGNFGVQPTGRRRCRLHGDQRHGAACPHRGVQGTVVVAGRLDGKWVDRRHRPGHRPGGRGRGRRDQLLRRSEHAAAELPLA